MAERLVDGLVAGAVAAVPSGLPSTLHAFWTGRDLMDTVRAAGSLLVPASAPDALLVASGVVAHVGISLGWGAVLGVVLPSKVPVAWGAVAGLAIAGLDLGIVGRRLPAIRALPPLPQIVDHLAYGAIVGAVLAHRRGIPFRSP
jgi:predicted ABC-type sugar transport system permease subunit